jgi:NAD(P)H dehydrogenase (quinone)
MAQILILYASDYGNTEKMAKATAEGVNSVAGAKAVVKRTEEATAEDMTASDGVIVGTPVHMGCMDWRVKKFIDTACSGLWMQNKMNGRVAGVFTSGSGFGGAGGGTEIAMLSVLSNFAELGMLIVPLPKNTENYKKGGLQWGTYGRSADEDMNHVGVSEEALGVARKHGANIARAAALLKGKTVFVP